jgi:MFS family permease
MPDHDNSTLPRRSPRSAKAIVFLVVVIDLLGFGIVLPLLPLYGRGYVMEVLGDTPRWETGLVVGLLMASFSGMQFLCSPIWGRVSDRVGRRPILIVGLGASVVFYTLFGFASDLPLEQAGLALWLLFAARIGQGIAGATIATAQAVIADCTPPEERKHGMAMIGMAFGVGFTFGPLVGFASLLLFPEHHGAIGYTAATLSGIALVLGVILMPETRDFETAPPLDRKWIDLQATVHVLRNPAIAPVVLTFFLATMGFASFEVTLAMLNEDALHLKGKEYYNFLIFAYVGLVLALTQGGLYRRVARKLTEPTLMAIGIGLMGLGVLALGGVTWVAVEHRPVFGALLTFQLVSLALAVVGFAFLTPSAQALVSRRSDPARQGEVLGVNQSCSAMARILGPIFGAALYLATPTHLLPYVFGGGVLLLMLPLIPRIRRGESIAAATAAPPEG